MSMNRLVGNRLPCFTKEQSELVKGAFDFIGINYYTAYYANNLPPPNGLRNDYTTDVRTSLSGESCQVKHYITSQHIIYSIKMIK